MFEEQTTALQMGSLTEHRFSAKKHSMQRPAMLYLAALGYFGLIFSMLSLYTPLVYRKVLFPVVLIGFLLTAGICLKIRQSGFFLTIIALLTLGVMPLRWHMTETGIRQLFNTVYCNAHHTDIAYFVIPETENPAVCATLVCCCMSILLACFFTYFTIRKPLFLLPAVLSFAVLEPGLYEGLPLYPPVFAPLLAYWLGMLVFRHTHQYVSDSSGGRQTAARAGVIMTWIVLAVYLTVFASGTLCSYTRTDADRKKMRELSQSLSSFDMENIPESLRKISSAMGYVHDTNVSILGRSSRLEYQDKEILTLTFDKLPDSTMYLKGFTGSTYTDNSWEKSAKNDTADFLKTSAAIRNFDCAPQNFPFLFQRSLLPDSETFQCTITMERQDGRYYQPYASYSESAEYPDDSNCRPSQKNGYTWTVSTPQNWVIYDVAESEMLQTTMHAEDLQGSGQIRSFLETLGIQSDSFSVESRFPLTAAATEPQSVKGKVIPAVMLESMAYRGFVRENDTLLPKSNDLDAVFAAMPEELAAQKPQTAMEQYETLSDIRDWLAECAVYDLAPGKTPRTRDFVNFFLLENRKGYCMHFATAGTILARYFGIPARYCEGYVVGKDILSKTETNQDGSSSLTLTDRQSHAWCEFYIDGYGWMPFEMTPGYYTAAPIVNHPEPTTTTTVPETEPPILSSEPPVGEQTLTATSTIASTQPPVIGQNNINPPPPTLPPILKNLLTALLVILAAAALNILLHRWYIRRRKIKISDCGNPQKAVLCSYSYFLRLMRWLGLPYREGLLTEYSGTAQTLLQKKQLPDDAPACIITAALAADMSGKLPSAESVQDTAKAVLILAKSMEQSCKPLKRLYLKYILYLF